MSLPPWKVTSPPASKVCPPLWLPYCAAAAVAQLSIRGVAAAALEGDVAVRDQAVTAAVVAVGQVPAVAELGVRDRCRCRPERSHPPRRSGGARRCGRRCASPPLPNWA